MDILTKEFFHIITHELRTPLTGLMNAVALLRQTLLNQEQEQYTMIAYLCGENLLAVLNDLQEFSRFEQQESIEISFEPFDLSSFLEEITATVELFKMENPLEFHLEIKVGTPSSLSGDADRLRQVLLHLLKNAFKFTRKGHVVLKVHPIEETEEEITLQFLVEDTGPGIPNYRIQDIFTPFHMIDTSPSREHRGFGIGLSIVKKIVETLGGKVSLQSEIGKGTRIGFTQKFIKTGGSVYPWYSSRLLDGVKVLLFDPYSSFNSPIALWLQQSGAVLYIAKDVSSAYEILMNRTIYGYPVHIVLVDLQNTGSEIDDLYQKVADEYLKDHIKVIGFLPFGTIGITYKYAFVRFSTCLMKPVRRLDLLRTLEALIQNSRLIDRKPDVDPTIQPEMKKESERGQISADQQPATHLRVLVVEDNLVNRITAETMLKKRGYSVDTVSSGNEALFFLSKEPYDIVFLDIQMPGMDGFETARKIRKGKSFVLDPSVPIIALTAYTYPEDRQKCQEAGMNDFIPKPFHPEDLIKKIEQWVLPKRIEQEIIQKAEAEQVEPQKPATIFNSEDFYRRLSGDQFIAWKVLNAFLIDTPIQLNQIHRSLQKGDLPALKRLAHSLKGASSAIGAERLQSVAGEMEQAADAGNLGKARTLWLELQNRWKEFLKVSLSSESKPQEEQER